MINLLINIDMKTAEILFKAVKLLDDHKEASVLYDIYTKVKEEEERKVAFHNEGTEEHVRKYREVLDLWLAIKVSPLSHFEIDQLCDLVNEYGKNWVLEALTITGQNGKCRLSYARTILSNWKTNGKEANKSFSQPSTVEQLLDKWND